MIIFKIAGSSTDQNSKFSDDIESENEYICSTSKKFHFEIILKRNIELVGDVIGSHLTKISSSSRSQGSFHYRWLENSFIDIGEMALISLILNHLK